MVPSPTTYYDHRKKHLYGLVNNAFHVIPVLQFSEEGFVMLKVNYKKYYEDIFFSLVGGYFTSVCRYSTYLLKVFANTKIYIGCVYYLLYPERVMQEITNVGYLD